MAEAQQWITDMKARLRAIEKKQNATAMEKAQAALNYAVSCSENSMSIA